MTVLDSTEADGRLLPTGDEAGTAPGDRPFRPDVQGLRAVAILLVVLFHAGVPGVGGGYVGVDVFFVISGFVITGLLLRESASTGKTSLRAFYGRRSRRIIPAATLVIVATVLASATFLGIAEVRQNAIDGIWSSIFLANFHFVASSTNYLAAQQFPSALQNFWSLAVEEQFYLVYPAVFLLVALVPFGRSLRTRLTWVLGLTIVGSFILSITLTASNAAAAYFLPFTRAWELALGALVAVLSRHLAQIPAAIAAVATWLGVGFVILAACTFTTSTPYPGSAAALPVVGTAMIIAGGTSAPRYGAETVLRLGPFQWLGLISYSLYLWHWPILTIAAQRQNATSLPVTQNLWWLLLALVLAIATYLVIENPIRHAKVLVRQKWASILLGGCLIAVSAGASAAVASTQHLAFLAQFELTATATACPTPTPAELAPLRTSYLKGAGVPATPSSQGRVRVALMGDSTACTLLPGLDAVAPSFGAEVENGSVVGCGIVSGTMAPIYFQGVNINRATAGCQSTADSVESQILRRDHPGIIVWQSMFERGTFVVDTAHGQQTFVSGTPAWRAEILRRMNEKVDSYLATGAKVILLLQPPAVDLGHPASPSPGDRSFEMLNELLTNVAQRHPGRVGVVDLSALVCPSGPPCPSVVAGIEPRPDNEHYGAAGTLWAASWLLPRILSASHALSG